MKIHLFIDLGSGRSGIEARSPELKLTSHGVDEQDAIKSLQRGIVAWGESLNTLDILTETLKRQQLKFEPNGQSIVVELEKRSN